MAKLKIAHLDADNNLHDLKVSPTLVNGFNVGGTGGLTSITGPQIEPTVKIGAASAAAGSILAQKGIHRFRVTDGTNTGRCTLSNLPSANLTADTMSIQVNTNYLTDVTANAMVVSGASTEAYVTWTTSVGPGTPAVGQFITGLSNILSNATISAINTTTNVTVSYDSQVFTNVAASSCNISVFAERINNKFVHGFNGIRYRYHLAQPDADFVRVPFA